MSDISDVTADAWMLYPVRAEQIKAAGSDDVDDAEWVIRVDGPLPGHPVKVVPEAEVDPIEANVRSEAEFRPGTVEQELADQKEYTAHLRVEVKRLRKQRAASVTKLASILRLTYHEDMPGHLADLIRPLCAHPADHPDVCRSAITAPPPETDER